jgi:hypothetical protein
MIGVGTPTPYIEGLSNGVLEAAEIEQRIVALLKERSEINLRMLVLRTGASQAQAAVVLKKLLDEEQITHSGDMFAWKR